MRHATFPALKEANNARGLRRIYYKKLVTETSTIPVSLQATFKDFVGFNHFTAEHILACFVPDCRVPYGSFHV
jgi:hypothetical protein